MSVLTRFRAAVARVIAPKAKAAPRRRNAYAGSLFDRLRQDWIFAASRSPDQELRYELKILRNRARELDRNSPLGARYSQLLAENVIGPDGIQLQAKNQRLDKSGLHKAANAAIEDAWKEWARPDNCDVAGRLSLTELLALEAASWGTDGEILIRLWRGPRFGPFGFQLQPIDPDYLDETLNQEPMGDRPMIRQGVEMDEYGKPVAYHLWTRHPNDPSGGMDRARIRVPASDIIHAFIPKRAGQSRGVPHAVAIMNTVKLLDGYIEAELVAARTASATMGAIVDATEDGAAPAISPHASGDQTGPNGDYLGTRPEGQAIPAEAEPGVMMDLRGQGAKLDMWDPQHPTSAFPDFTRMLSHFIAIGYGVSYGTLTGDLSQANYGSLRVGMLDERDHWRRFQTFFITHVLDRVYRAWLPMALLNQQIAGVQSFDASRWTRVAWQPRGFDWIDPQKDIAGDLLEVAAGVGSLTRLAAKKGRDLEEVLEERQEEMALLDEYGVQSVIATTITDRPQEPTGDGTNEPTQDGGSAPASEKKAAGKALSLARVRRTANGD